MATADAARFFSYSNATFTLNGETFEGKIEFVERPAIAALDYAHTEYVVDFGPAIASGEWLDRLAESNFGLHRTEGETEWRCLGRANHNHIRELMERALLGRMQESWQDDAANPEPRRTRGPYLCRQCDECRAKPVLAQDCWEAQRERTPYQRWMQRESRRWRRGR